MPPNRFESEVESFLEGSHGDRTHIKRADHHTVTPLCGTLLCNVLGRSQKMTEGNYVRLLGDPACAVTNRCGRQLCETVITFACECSVSSETDGTIARQKHPFSVLSWCAKASWVSRKRAEDPALVLTVSSCRAASSFGAK